MSEGDTMAMKARAPYSRHSLPMWTLVKKRSMFFSYELGISIIHLWPDIIDRHTQINKTCILNCNLSSVHWIWEICIYLFIFYTFGILCWQCVRVRWVNIWNKMLECFFFWRNFIIRACSGMAKLFYITLS